MPAMPALPDALEGLVSDIAAHDAVLASRARDALLRLLRAATSLAWARDHAASLAAASSEQAVLEHVVATASALTGAPEVWALGWEPRGSQPRITAVAGSTPRVGDELLRPEVLSRSLVAEVVASGRPAWSDDAASDARYAAARSIAALQLRSVGCLPLGERAVLYLADPTTAGRFDADQRSQLSALCTLAAAWLAPAPPSAKPRAQPLPGLVGRSAAMAEVASQVRAFAPLPWPLLVRGETGTGKELVARAVHQLGPTASGPFVAANAGAIPDTLAESTLFGHVRGAFTGADRDHAGWVGEADGGTLFLDEVGELSHASQVRLLRLLQEGTYQRVGEARTRRFTGRIVAATHQAVDQADSGFRADLYHRLSAAVVQLPPLRERLDDLPLLAEHLLATAAAELGRPPPALAPATVGDLAARPWPGNVRQLQNAMRYALARALADGSEQLLPAHLPPGGSAGGGSPLALATDLATATTRFQQEQVRAALAQSQGNKSDAARALGVSRQWLHRLVARWDAEGPW
jgi:DNA-binding NtrC family response regulator